jgi:hypothetical protein
MSLSFLLKCPRVQDKETGKKAQEKEKCVSAQVVEHGGRRSGRRKAPAIDVQAAGDVEGNGPKEDDEERIRHKDRAGKPEIQNEEKAQKQLVGELLEKAFSGSAEKLVMRALSAKKVSAKELASIKKMLDDFEGE